MSATKCAALISYRKNKKKEKERRSGAGAGGGKPWKYARIMAFIDPFMEERAQAGADQLHHRPRSRQQERAGERQDEAETRLVMLLMRRGSSQL